MRERGHRNLSRSLSPSEDEGDRQIHPTSDHKSKITGTEREEQRGWGKPRTDASILLSVPSDGLLGTAVSVCAVLPLMDQQNQSKPLTQQPAPSPIVMQVRWPWAKPNSPPLHGALLEGRRKSGNVIVLSESGGEPIKLNDSFMSDPTLSHFSPQHSLCLFSWKTIYSLNNNYVLILTSWELKVATEYQLLFFFFL